ncbi:MAG TPA: hypothetical protein VNH11_12425 [Pirellulales bacterium]|nr:hypothetical protein [Pirellulales bacterium]
MRGNQAKLIEQWFTEYSQDGDFVYEGRPLPYTVMAPAKARGRIVFATKPGYAAQAIYESSEYASIGLIGRYGLPCRFDLAWIRDVAAKHQLFFLGDMDHPDLMIFCWLRARLHPKRIEHLGVNDAYLHQLQVQLPDSFIMRCSRSERRSLPVLQKAFPDLCKTVGVNCARMLEQGQKIELDAVKSALGAFTPLLRPLIASRK